jgi:hypothetical protein
MPARGEFGCVLDPKSFAELLAATKAFSPKLATRLRKRLRDAGQSTITDIRGVLSESTPAGNSTPGPVRTALAAGTKVSIRAGKSAQGVRIVTRDRANPVMAKAYNKRSWRHPVFGDRENWVTEGGRPYFGAVISRHQREFQDAVVVALNEAADVFRDL